MMNVKVEIKMSGAKFYSNIHKPDGTIQLTPLRDTKGEALIDTELNSYIDINEDSEEFKVVSRRLAKRLLLDGRKGEKIVRIMRWYRPCIGAPKTYNYTCIYQEKDMEGNYLLAPSSKISLRNTEKYFSNEFKATKKTTSEALAW